MHTLKFTNDKARTLSQMVTFMETRQRRIPYTKEYSNDFGLWLVKDHGIYLMSPTDEKFVNTKGVVNTVVYAKGYKPTKKNKDTLWDKTHDVSGDDFAEFIPLIPPQIANIKKGGGIVIELSETEISVEA